MQWPNRTLFFTSSLILLIIMTSVPQVRGLGGVFELKIRSFTNPSGKDGEGRCCVGNNVNKTRTSSLSSSVNSYSHDLSASGVYNSDTSNNNNQNAGCGKGQCATKFRVCVKHYQVTIDPAGPCYFGETVTETLNSNNLTDGGRTFHFPFNFRWPGTFSLIIEAWHHQHNASQRLITRMAIQQYLDVGEEWKDREWTGNEGQVALKYDYRVRCLPDYYGDACDKTCRPRDDKFGHYTCSDQGDIVCLAGWTGSYCEKAVCLQGCHETHGLCNNPNECLCHTGWEGMFCSECVPYPGCKHGRCSKPFECECEEGWGGLFCNQDLNYCTNHRPCQNGGTCFNTGQGSYTCSCPAGFNGNDCESRADGCTCVNGGTCRENGTATFCQCPEGWSGPNCETLSLTCSDSPCVNGGTCTETTQVTCLCPPGFGGVFCDTAIAEQVTTNDCGCQNGGSCTSSGSCLCPSGAYGIKCETRVDNCASIQCENGGTCESVNSGYRCRCALGWAGDKCAKEVNICTTLPCANGGTCSPLPENRYKCDCTSNFGGQDCSLPCECENGGLCTGMNANECTCPLAFTGPKCQFISNVTTYETVPPNAYPITEESLSAQHVIFVIIVSVATPLMVVVAVAVVLLLKRRKRAEQRRNDELARIQNEQNTVQCLTKKCIDPHMIVNTLDIPKAKCSNLDLSFNKPEKHHHQQHQQQQLNQQYPSMKGGGGGSSSCLLDKGDLLHNGCNTGHPYHQVNRVNGLLINTSLNGGGDSSCYSSPVNHYSPKSLQSSNSHNNLNNLTPLPSPSVIQSSYMQHPSYHPHHHPQQQHPNNSSSSSRDDQPNVKDHSQNLATEV